MFVNRYILEEYNIPNLGYLSLILPGYSKSSPGVLLFAEGVEQFEGNFPPGELVLNWDFCVDFVSVTVPES